MNLAWKLNRVRTMERGEIAWRVQQQLHARLQRFGLFAAPSPPPAQAVSGAPWLDSWPVQFDVAKYCASADRVLAGEFDVFALRPARLGFPPRWNQDPKTGRLAPLRFGRSLDYRDERLVGDIKYLWEPSRHSELVGLAQAWRLTGDVKYSDGCRVLLESWFDQCPYLLGVHWTSSLEHGIRLVNWALAWHLLGGSAAPVFDSPQGRSLRHRWLCSVYQHCHFIAGHLSRYSSANNHLLGERLGLFVAAITWPCWSESARWRDESQHEFEEQALLQNAADGVNREQAVWYHHEVADMMLLAGLFARANGRHFSARYWQRLEAMLEFIASIMDVGGNVPAFGDADDAIIARLDPTRQCSVYASLLASGAVMFDRSDFALKAVRLDDKTRWLLGDAAAVRFATLRAAASVTGPPRREFAEGGYYVMGDRYETAQEVRIVFDAGPLGYRSIAAHGHADALSFTLSVGGLELLIDPGTFAYHTQKKWRDYFRGTAAHNTVRVDGRDQSEIGGNFMWLTHAQARVLDFGWNGESEWILAEHDGYRRLADPVLHRREVRFNRRAATIVVCDQLVCSGEHEIELFWHFAEQCAVELRAGAVCAWREHVGLRMELPLDAHCEVLHGVEHRPGGWRSLRFDERIASPTVRAVVRIRGQTRLLTHISLLRRNSTVHELPTRAADYSVAE